MTASPPSPTIDHRPATIIQEDAVSIATLDELFKWAFYKTKIDDEGDLYVTGGLEVPIWIRVDAERKLITFFTFMHRDLNDHSPRRWRTISTRPSPCRASMSWLQNRTGFTPPIMLRTRTASSRAMSPT